MNPTVVTYIGLVVALFILIWSFVEIGRRYLRRQRNVDPQLMHTWLPLKPSSSHNPEDLFVDEDEGEQDEIARADFQTRAQQNGHYSETQKKL